MDVQAAILAAIADRPADDTPRLAYADWLDDHAADLPDPAAARGRAEFIRIQCELKQLDHLPSAELQGYADLYRRQNDHLTDNRRALLGPVADALGPHDAVFDRGFVTELHLRPADFVRHAADIAGLTPRPDVKLTRAVPGRRLFASPHLDLVTSLHVRGLDAPPDDAPDPDGGPAWPRLRELVLSECGVDDNIFGELMRALSYPALTDLDLSRNDISDAGVAALVASPLWPQLQVLDLGANPISDDGAALLAHAPPTALRVLKLPRTGITREGQLQLLRRREWKVDLF